MPQAQINHIEYILASLTKIVFILLFNYLTWNGHKNRSIREGKLDKTCFWYKFIYHLIRRSIQIKTNDFFFGLLDTISVYWVELHSFYRVELHIVQTTVTQCSNNINHKFELIPFSIQIQNKKQTQQRPMVHYWKEITSMNCSVYHKSCTQNIRYG